MIVARSRSEPTNYNCPKCSGHVWWDDEIEYVEHKPKGWWQRMWGPACIAQCPEGEHVHRSDRCVDCGWRQRRIETTNGDPVEGLPLAVRSKSRWDQAS